MGTCTVGAVTRRSWYAEVERVRAGAWKASTLCTHKQILDDGAFTNEALG